MRNESCDRKPKCDDYKHNHCDGCGGNKPTGDLISREALKKELELSKYIIPNDLNRLLNSEINRCIEAIDNAPTVEPETKVVANVTFNKEQLEKIVKKAKTDILAQIERPQGEWIYTNKEDKEKGYGGYCSNCKCDMPIFNEDWKMKYCETNFCPNCGAKMQKGDAE